MTSGHESLSYLSRIFLPGFIPVFMNPFRIYCESFCRGFYQWSWIPFVFIGNLSAGVFTSVHESLSYLLGIFLPGFLAVFINSFRIYCESFCRGFVFTSVHESLSYLSGIFLPGFLPVFMNPFSIYWESFCRGFPPFPACFDVWQGFEPASHTKKGRVLLNIFKFQFSYQYFFA